MEKARLACRRNDIESFGASDAFVIRLNCTSAEIKLHFDYRTFNNL